MIPVLIMAAIVVSAPVFGPTRPTVAAAFTAIDTRRYRGRRHSKAEVDPCDDVAALRNP